MRQKELDLYEQSRIKCEQEKNKVEPAVRKLLDEKMAIRRRRRELDKREGAVDTALEILGIRVAEEAIARGFMRISKLEGEYEFSRPFREMSLPDACLSIINAHEGLGLDKKQVEYCLVLGGYPFDAKDPTNSVEVTLRKLAGDGKCDAIKGTGKEMSRYRSLAGLALASEFDLEALRRPNVDDDAEDSGTTKAPGEE